MFATFCYCTNQFEIRACAHGLIDSSKYMQVLHNSVKIVKVGHHLFDIHVKKSKNYR